MSNPLRLLSYALHFMMLVCLAFGFTQPVRAAADLPMATESVLSGVSFDDKPLYLPVQKNFQMAMLTAGSELGRSCGKMEAFGWRLAQTEQGRVDQIFTATVQRFRTMGYDVQMQNPTSISHDISMFTADRPNKHFMSMWSAGEVGLVMVLCETSPGAKPRPSAVPAPVAAPSVETFTQDIPLQPTNVARSSYEKFTPVGKWVGSYVCGQGYTGATLTINALHGSKFDGTFHFYPTAKNHSVPDGSYTIYGDYDRASQRILINPGRWLKRPQDYYNTIIVGSFDVMTPSLSAYFQGITGCTSFEAKRDTNGALVAKLTAHTKPAMKKAAPKKKVKAVAKPDSVKLDDIMNPAKAPAAAPATDAAPAKLTPKADMAPPAPAPIPAADAGDAPPSGGDKPPLEVGAPTPAQ